MLVFGWVHLLFFASCFCFPPISWTSTSLSCGCGRTSMDHVVFCIVDSISPAEAWNSHCQHPRCFGQVFPWIFCWQKKKSKGLEKWKTCETVAIEKVYWPAFWVETCPPEKKKNTSCEAKRFSFRKLLESCSGHPWTSACTWNHLPLLQRSSLIETFETW